MATGSKPTKASARAATPPPKRRTKLDPVRRTLTAYVGAALVLAVVTLAGIVVLGGSLGPFIVFGAVLLGAGLVQRTARRRLAGTPLSDEDRVMQTMGAGMLFLSVVLAGAGALISAFA